MQAAKEAAKNFLHRDRQHDTEVCEEFKPAVTKETVVPVEKIEETIAVDREIHQDHYQTRIQPIEDHVHQPERHEHHVLPVEHREQRHGKDTEIRRKLEQEAQQFKSTTTVLPTTHEKISGGSVSGEHIHHHVHEVVQPVIEREVIQPTVIHTTIPIHERIEHEPTFHPATVQPKITLDEFKRAGGVLDGSSSVCDKFTGEPQIKENGGAQQTHPNAHGNHNTKNVIGTNNHGANNTTGLGSSQGSNLMGHNNTLGTNNTTGLGSSNNNNHGVNRPTPSRMMSGGSDRMNTSGTKSGMSSGMSTPALGSAR
ncbi:Similar to hypothetical protein SS1G_13755 [Sclerotinia sclerotiorum 1980]; acc. no. XP_001585187 [Pyronema omphalodes CBS 100304]|uniref:Allergen n=1 Tax=Pyronema omphalodes (strain CBS 100304) TaxID=1076935 RepID=U4LG79_PYROM|nr:Similar to hypothetical protein SS1G_13755 [Sclerotinia sclerotiorum 1980]; acc. no. XP_001585187 [Pyronema omphalodes CBS 100304]